MSWTCGYVLLDEAVLDKLSDDIGEGGRAEVVKLFLTEAPRMVDRLEQASISRGGALLREVHTLASAARSVGLLRVGYTAACIELMMANAEPTSDSLTSLLELMREGIVRLTAWEAASQLT